MSSISDTPRNESPEDHQHAVVKGASERFSECEVGSGDSEGHGSSARDALTTPVTSYPFHSSPPPLSVLPFFPSPPLLSSLLPLSTLPISLLSCSSFPALPLSFLSPISLPLFLFALLTPPLPHTLLSPPLRMLVLSLLCFLSPWHGTCWATGAGVSVG